MTRARSAALPALTGLLLGALAGCASAPAAAPETIRVTASDVMPFQPANSVWYSSATLRAKQPFARWEQQRDRIELVTWPRSCARVPVVIAFTPTPGPVRVETGRAPHSGGPRQCSPGHVLTSTFVGPRAMRRDRPTTLVLDGHRILLPPARPPAPRLRLERVPLTVSGQGRPHPLHQVNGPLPQYSVRDYPWNLTAAVTAAPQEIHIGWIGGTCEQNASVVHVVETPSRVEIDTALAPPPVRPAPAKASRSVVCAGVGVGLSATVHLARPLGTRTLLQHQWAPRPADQNAF